MNSTQNKSVNILEKIDEILKSNVLPILVRLNQSSIEQFMEHYSNEVDALILGIEKRENLNYVAGYAILKVVSETEQTMSLLFDLYFQNQQQQWINKKMQTETFLISDYLTEIAANELYQAKEIKYDVDKPER